MHNTVDKIDMPKTLIELDLSASPYKNDMIHNRWHPDIPMVATVKPGDDFIIETYDWTGGFNGFFSKKNGGGFLTDHFPLAQKSIWDISGLFTKSRHVPGVSFAGLIHPGLIGCLPAQKLLDTWNKREVAFMATNPTRVPPLANPPFAETAH